MTISKFIFGDYNSFDDCGLYLEKRPQRTSPKRDCTLTHVPGRSGDVYQDNGSWQNIDLTYKVGCSNIDGRLDAIKAMLAQPGYKMLQDSYDPLFFYFAAVTSPAVFEEELFNFGHAEISFTAMPFRYYVPAYFQTLSVSVGAGSTTLKNPYEYSAAPLLHIKAPAGQSCTIYVNDGSYLFKMPTGCTDASIDCESMSAYNGYNNLTAGCEFDSFPELKPGTNLIRVQGASSATITTRWRCL